MRTGGALNLPAVMAGAVVAFLLLTLLIAGVIVGAVLLRRARRKGKNNNKKSKMVKIECEEQQEVSLVNESTAGNDSEWRVAQAAFHYEQHAEDLHYENIDIGGQGCRGREEGNGIRSEEGHYDVVVAADNVPLNGRAGHGSLSSKEVQVQQDDQSTRDTPDALYAVVDKSKKKKQEKTQDGASATTTQGADTEEQHYEWSSGLGQDWFENVVEEHGEVGQESLSNEANETGPQSVWGAVCVKIQTFGLIYIS